MTPQNHPLDFLKTQITISGRDVDDDLIKGVRSVVVIGCFTYSTFGEVRHSAFCFFFRAPDVKPEHFAYCGQGNYAD